MKILDKLMNLVDAKFKEVLSKNKIILFDFSRNTKNLFEIKEGGKLSIDMNKATEEQKKLFKEQIIDAEFDDAGNFLTSRANNKTRQIKNNLPTESDEEILNFYKDKLSYDMWKALEIAITIRNSFNKGEDITDLKRDIIHKYPVFGNNLSNLTTQGYFDLDRHFKQLYESMLEDEGFDIVNYRKKVEKIVESLPYIVFITRYKTYDELSGEVKFKLTALKKYGTGILLLHGLGTENVSTALAITDEYKDDESIRIEKEMNLKRTIITVTFRF